MMRTCYYKLIRAMSPVRHIEHFTGFGLYDQSFLALLREIKDPAPYLRGIVAEYAPSPAIVQYEQMPRRAGTSSNSFASLYDAAMLGFTTYTKTPIRMMTLFGVLCLLASLVGGGFAIALGVAGEKAFSLVAVLSAIGFFGAVNLLALSVIGEYALPLKQKSGARPRVVEERRINFEREGQ
jgi:hypothetical protein